MYDFTTTSPILDTTSLLDYVRHTYRLQSLKMSNKHAHIEVIWNCPSGLTYHAFLAEHFTTYTAMGANGFIATGKEGFVYGVWSKSENTIDLEIEGDEAWVLKLVEKFDALFNRQFSASSVDWYYRQGPGITYTRFKVSSEQGRSSFYPWMKKPLDAYIDEFMDSGASILVLLGPPGTGKSSFIKHMIDRAGAPAMVAYDNDTMTTDQVFINFLSGSYRFFIMEDADTLMAAREDGNQMMHKFLNLSNGIISTTNKKLVFSTNLPSLGSVDSALIRPGRCFDTLEFRSLSRSEAEAVCVDMGREMPDFDGQEISLAQLLNGKMANASVRRVGFLP
jgi:hypothetical protein